MLSEKVTAIWHEMVEQVCYYVAGPDGVGTNAMRNALHGKHVGELRESALGSGIRSNLREAEEAGIRSDVDDRTALVWDHRAYSFTGVKEGTSKVDGESVVPFLQRQIQNRRVFDGCGVVYKDVDLMARGLGLD